MLVKYLGPQRQQLPKKNSGCHLPTVTNNQSAAHMRKREYPAVKLHFLTIYKALGNELAFCIYILNFLRSYVLSLCQLENVLLPNLIDKIQYAFIFSKKLELLG